MEAMACEIMKNVAYEVIQMEEEVKRDFSSF